MAFSTGLSGINAANQDLKVTGNNVANASTTGFKLSRAEFGDSYTQSILGMGRTPVGSGVNVANIGQKFTQGNISQTNNALDLAIDGTGFFITDYPGSNTTYTRSGIFGINNEGFMVNNQGARLQGFGISEQGQANGVLGDIRIDQAAQAPQATQRVDAGVNVPAGAEVLQQLGSITTTRGLAVGQVQSGLADATASTLSALGPPRQEGTPAEIIGTNDFTGGGTLNGNLELAFTSNLPGGEVLSLNDTLNFDGATFSSADALVRGVQRAIDNSSLAGKVRAESMLDGGDRVVRLVADGPYSGYSHELEVVSDTTGAGLPAVADTGALADTLFPPSIDLTTIEGTAPTVVGGNATQLDFSNKSTLTGAVDLASAFSYPVEGLDNMELTLTLTDAAGDTVDGDLSVELSGSFGEPQDLVTRIHDALDGMAAPFDNLSAILNADNRIVITNLTPNAGELSISDSGSGTVVNAETIGLDSDEAPRPVYTPANNVLQIEVNDDGATLVIPQNDYVTINQLVDAINSQLATFDGIFAANVRAESVNDRIAFTLSERGKENSLSVEGEEEALAAIGHTVQSRPPVIDPVDRQSSFSISLFVPAPDADNRSGTVEINLDENIRSIEQLAQAINRELSDVPEDDFIGVVARVATGENGQKRLELVATEEGEGSQITLGNVQAIGEDISLEELNGLLQFDSFATSTFVEGEPAVTNGYPEQSFVLIDEEGEERQVTLDAGLSASRIAAQLSELPGVLASATTNLTLQANGYSNAGDMNITVNGQVIEANSFANMVTEINSYQQTSLRGITASLSDSGDLLINSRSGGDIELTIDTPRTVDQVTLVGRPGTAPVTLGGTADADETARVGGEVEIILNEGVSMSQPNPRVTGLFNGLTDSSFDDFVLNEFDPNDANTYNETASLTIYDSLGTTHQLQLFFVKDPNDPNRPQDLNSWTVHAQVDGQDVGDPDETLPFPQNQEPTQASLKMFFNPDGTLNRDESGDWLISNWLPRDANGEPIGAFQPENTAEGGRLPLDSPNATSNFEINFRDTTQYGGDFARNDFQQDGYASGRLRDLSIDDEGNVFARYTNGENQLLGQVAIANFRNPEGLEPSGFTEWMETADSGSVTVSSAGTGVLGNVRSSALEDSNVDLSEQLVNLIVAQRNYQASAKTIETTNAVTQTIINLR